MDFKDSILQLAEKIERQKDDIATEEATKTSFIMPMIAALGYDVFNPFEVVPEMDCDLTKRGDRIDYAIIKDNQPILLMECNHHKPDDAPPSVLTAETVAVLRQQGCGEVAVKPLPSEHTGKQCRDVELAASASVAVAVENISPVHC